MNVSKAIEITKICLLITLVVTLIGAAVKQKCVLNNKYCKTFVTKKSHNFGKINDNAPHFLSKFPETVIFHNLCGQRRVEGDILRNNRQKKINCVCFKVKSCGLTFLSASAVPPQFVPVIIRRDCAPGSAVFSTSTATVSSPAVRKWHTTETGIGFVSTAS